MERRIRVGMRQIDMYSYVLVKQKKDRRGNGMKEHASCRIEDVISQKEGVHLSLRMEFRLGGRINNRE
jgi:hypothetical protein